MGDTVAGLEDDTEGEVDSTGGDGTGTQPVQRAHVLAPRPLLLLLSVSVFVFPALRAVDAASPTLPAALLAHQLDLACRPLRCDTEGVRRGSGGGTEGIYRSSLDAREPQNPTK
eukprot:407470-Prorocentrum_minimum.AAC.1